MLFFFFDFKDTAKQDTRAALSSVLVQLRYQSDLCPDIISCLFSAHRFGTIQSSDETLKKCSKDILALPRKGQPTSPSMALTCSKSIGTLSPRESDLDLVEWLTKLSYPTYIYASRAVPRQTSKPIFIIWYPTAYCYTTRADNNKISTITSFLL